MKKIGIVMYVLRLLLGWNFLFEGTLKLFSSVWTSKLFLIGSPIFSFLGQSETIVGLIDWSIIILTMAIGFSLIVGVCVRQMAIVAAILLFLFYLAYPPFYFNTEFKPSADGNYFIVGRDLINGVVMVVIALWRFKEFFIKNGKVKYGYKE